jgi:hypothetical protein
MAGKKGQGNCISSSRHNQEESCCSHDLNRQTPGFTLSLELLRKKIKNSTTKNQKPHFLVKSPIFLILRARLDANRHLLTRGHGLYVNTGRC